MDLQSHQLHYVTIFLYNKFYVSNYCNDFIYELKNDYRRNVQEKDKQRKKSFGMILYYNATIYVKIIYDELDILKKIILIRL